jgi:hypothetical protein
MSRPFARGLNGTAICTRSSRCSPPGRPAQNVGAQSESFLRAFSREPPVGGVDLPEEAEESSFPACEAGCSTPRKPRSGDPAHKPASSVDAVRVPHGVRRRRTRGQQERSVEVAKPHRKGRWRGTWLLSKFREQRGVFVARATTVVIVDHRCAWEGLSMNRDSLLALFMALGSGEGTLAL